MTPRAAGATPSHAVARRAPARRALPAACAVAATAGCAALFASLYPGMSNPDMAREYIGLLRGIYADWNPPLMTFAWSLVEPLAPGKAGLFLLFLASYAAAVALTFGMFLSLHPARFALLAPALVVLLAFPGFLAQGAMLFKDFLMATLFLAGAACAVLHAQARSAGAGRLWLAAALLGIASACLVRTNAVFGASVLLLGLLAPGTLRRGVVRAGLHAALVSAALIPAASLANRVLFDPKPLSVENSLFIFDFAGITRHAGENAFPEEVRAIFTTADNAGCYSPLWWDPFIDWRDLHAERFGAGEAYSVAFVADPRFARCQAVWRLMRRANVESGRSFAADWARAVLSHPLAYARHRAAYANQLLEFLVPHNRPVARLAEQENSFGWTYAPNAVARPLLEAANRLGGLPVSWSFLWLVVAAVSFVSAARAPAPERAGAANRAVVAISGSGVFYTLGLVVVGVASEYRYHLWLLLAAGVSALLLACRAHERGELVRLAGRYAAWSAPFVLLAGAWRVLDLPAPG